jgi:serine protease DegQ
MRLSGPTTMPPPTRILSYRRRVWRRLRLWRQLRGWTAAASVALALAACGAAPDPPAATGANVATSPGTAQPADAFSRIPGIVESVQPSIVTVFAGQGVGSGVVYRADGIILTNRHVVAGAQRLEVAFADGRRASGRVIATDPNTDLAAIRVERTGLPAARFATALPRVGDLAVVLGSPLGFEKTVTAGIISGLHRSIPGSAAETRSLVDLIQTDAPISPGNSGGAVVGADGQVVGISEAYIPPNQGAVAIGFAIPAATAKQVADQLIANGRAEHAYLGLQPAELTPAIASELEVGQASGVLVYAIAPTGPAAKAGLRPGDVMTKVGDETLTSVEDLFAALRRHAPGETVAISYLRDGHPGEAQAQLSAAPS